MKTVQFNGTITTLSPVTVSLPDVSGMARTTQGLPMIPASTLRGLLRHSAHEAMAYLSHQAGRNLTVDQHYMLAAGVDTARVIKDGAATKVGHTAALRAKNPMLSVFGRWGLAGRLGVGSAVAQDANCLIIMGNGSRHHPFNRNPGLTDCVPVEELDYLQQILMADSQASESTSDLKDEEKALKKEVRGASAERKAEINARLAEIAAIIREVKDERVGSREAIQRPLDGFEAIDAGHQLSHRMTLQNPTDQELHLVLWAIAIASHQPMVGGHRNLGCGYIAGDWTITSQSLGEGKPVELGKVGFNDEGFFCTVPGFDADAVSQAIKSGEIALTDFA